MNKNTNTKRILVLGLFGNVTNLINGQSIKTREILNLLNAKLSAADVDWFDTQYFKVRKTSVGSLLVKMLKADTIIYLPGRRELRYVFPAIYSICRLLKKEIIYAVVGGWLSEFIADKPGLQSKLRKVKAILVESASMKRKLQVNYSYDNVEVFPNFRITDYTPVKEIHKDFRIAFMARISEPKGWRRLIDFAEYYKRINGTVPFSINYYGPVDAEEKDEFLETLSRYDNINYYGTISPHNVYKTLNENDVCVLPTSYEGEGFPGTIIDSYIAGIPVIVSKWKDLPEFVEVGKTGFVFDLDYPQQMYDLIISLMDNSDLLSEMKVQSNQKSNEFSAETGWKTLSRYLIS